MASRYCEVDSLTQFAWANFGAILGARAKVEAICTFVHNHLTFDYLQARATRTAVEAMNERVGVCRDFTHLAVALCRAMAIPARYCNGYLGDIGVPPDPSPMDFSAWFEAYLDGAWYTYDPRHNARRIGRIVISRGRDATDTAMITSFGASHAGKVRGRDRGNSPRGRGVRVWLDRLSHDRGLTGRAAATGTFVARRNLLPSWDLFDARILSWRWAAEWRWRDVFRRSRPGALSMAKILVAEDSEPIWEFLQQRLERKGHIVILAHDGENAVSNAKSTQPDLILMDMNLPVMDGSAAARAIKGDPHTAAIPIIAMAANVGEDERGKALQAGCDAFHPKPIDFVLLMHQIDAALLPPASDPHAEGDSAEPAAAP